MQRRRRLPRKAVSESVLEANGLLGINCNNMLFPIATTTGGVKQIDVDTMTGRFTAAVAQDVDHLPTYSDLAILLPIIAAARLDTYGRYCANFSSAYEMRKVLGVTYKGKTLVEKITAALDRYQATILNFKDCFFVGTDRVQTSISYNIVSSYTLIESSDSEDGQTKLKVSFNKDFMEMNALAFRRCIDPKVLSSLKSAMSKAVYWFLKTRMHNQRYCVLSTEELCTRAGIHEVDQRKIGSYLKKAISDVNTLMISDMDKEMYLMNYDIRVKKGKVYVEDRKYK